MYVAKYFLIPNDINYYPCIFKASEQNKGGVWSAGPAVMSGVWSGGVAIVAVSILGSVRVSSSDVLLSTWTEMHGDSTGADPGGGGWGVQGCQDPSPVVDLLCFMLEGSFLCIWNLASIICLS